MPEPVTIAAYLVRLNGELVVGLGRRRRILAELEDHLRTATAAAVADGATQRQAEASAIAALGTPEDVASTFRRDLPGRIDRAFIQLSGAGDRLYARRPFVGALARDWPPHAAIAVSMMMLAAVGLIPLQTATPVAALWVVLLLPLQSCVHKWLQVSPPDPPEHVMHLGWLLILFGSPGDPTSRLHLAVPLALAGWITAFGGAQVVATLLRRAGLHHGLARLVSLCLGAALCIPVQLTFVGLVRPNTVGVWASVALGVVLVAFLTAGTTLGHRRLQHRSLHAQLQARGFGSA